jgi:multicomponent Na+:H+ antiporter subunit E
VWYQIPVHIALALVWMIMWGSFAPFHVVAGFVVGGAILYALNKGTGGHFYLRRVVSLFKLIALFLWQIVLSGIFVARIAIAPRPGNRPGVVAFPLRLKTDGTITALTHMLTLTPGAVPIDISADRSEIFIHCLDLNDVDAVREAKELFEDLLLEVTE